MSFKSQMLNSNKNQYYNKPLFYDKQRKYLCN